MGFSASKRDNLSDRLTPRAAWWNAHARLLCGVDMTSIAAEITHRHAKARWGSAPSWIDFLAGIKYTFLLSGQAPSPC